jgi:hypothetical protein
MSIFAGSVVTKQGFMQAILERRNEIVSRSMRAANR